MLTQKFRPRTFSEVAGQDLVKDLLKHGQNVLRENSLEDS